MTASSANGILRSRPRYSSASNDSQERAIIPPSAGDTIVSDAPSPTRFDSVGEGLCASMSTKCETLGNGTVATSTIPSRKTKATKGVAQSPRSLASLVKCALNLNAEANGITKNESGNVISHKPSSSGSANNDARQSIEGENRMPTLQISDEGTPYLKSNFAADDVSSGPEVVADVNDVIALGVMGEDGQKVRFCEYDDVDDNNSSKVNGGTLSGKDKLHQRIDAESDGEFDFDDAEGNSNDDLDSNSSGSLANDKEILDELGLSESFSDDEEEKQMDVERKSQLPTIDLQELRSFRVLWELLTRWATPSTIQLVLHYQRRCSSELQQQNELSPPVVGSSRFPQEEKSNDSNDSRKRNTVDVGASRMASIMSMLKMNIRRSLSELTKIHHKPKLSQVGTEIVIDQRKVEQRLADIVRTFDPTAPAANLNMKMWRGLTTVLIAMSFPSLSGAATGEDSSTILLLPPSIRPLNLSVEEYRYLTQSAIVSLGSTDDL